MRYPYWIDIYTADKKQIDEWYFGLPKPDPAKWIGDEAKKWEIIAARHYGIETGTSWE